MKILTIEQIQELTLSKGITTPNPVYYALQDLSGIYLDDLDNNPLTNDFSIMDVPQGSLACVSGCSQKGTTSLYFVNEVWVRLPNKYMKHYANSELIEADV